jgi:hypothetical protein
MLSHARFLLTPTGSHIRLQVSAGAHATPLSHARTSSHTLTHTRAELIAGSCAHPLANACVLQARLAASPRAPMCLRRCAPWAAGCQCRRTQPAVRAVGGYRRVAHRAGLRTRPRLWRALRVRAEGAHSQRDTLWYSRGTPGELTGIRWPVAGFAGAHADGAARRARSGARAVHGAAARAQHGCPGHRAAAARRCGSKARAHAHWGTGPVSLAGAGRMP